MATDSRIGKPGHGSNSREATARQKQLPFDGRLDVERVRRNARRIQAVVIAEAKLSPSLKALLAALWSYYGSYQFCWPSLKTLALRLGHAWPGSRGALCAKILKLKQLGLIIVEERQRPDGSRTSSKYKIIWHRLRTRKPVPAVINFRDPPVSLERRGGLSAETGGSLQRDGGASPERPLELVLNLNVTPNQPPTNSPCNEFKIGGVDKGNEREEAVKALAAYGVNCIPESLGQSVSPSRVLDLVKVAKSGGSTAKSASDNPHGWNITPGILVQRIKHDLSDKDTGVGWHPYAQNILDSLKTPAGKNCDKPRRPELSSNQRDSLNSRWLAAIKAMDDTSFNALCDEAGLSPAFKNGALKDRAMGFVVEVELFVAMERRSVSENQLAHAERR